MLLPKPETWPLGVPICFLEFLRTQIGLGHFNGYCFDILIVNFIELDATALSFTWKVFSDHAFVGEFTALKGLGLAWSTETGLATDATLDGLFHA